MQFEVLITPIKTVSKAATIGFVLLTPLTTNTEKINEHKIISQYVYDGNKGYVRNEFKKFNYKDKILLVDLFPDSTDFTPEEEAIYSEAAQKFYGDVSSASSIYDLYYG